MFIVVISVFISCKSTFISLYELPENIKKIPLSDYDLYTFQMVVNDECSSVPASKRPFENSVNNNSDFIVYEELYLLLHKKKKEVLYLTTFSHKYIYDNGVFNKKENDSLISFNQIEYLYEGIVDEVNKEFVFKNPVNSLLRALYIKYEKVDDIVTFKIVPNVHPSKDIRKNKPSIDLESLFSVSIQFKKDARLFSYEEKGVLNYVDTIYHDRSSIFFQVGKNLSKCSSYRKLNGNKERIWYFLK